LASYNILSAPILMGATVEEENEGTYIGIVDVSTLLHAFVDGMPIAKIMSLITLLFYATRLQASNA
jgi:hypothetical protein